MSYDIEFHNVSFRYEDTGDWAIRDVNLQIPQGQTVLVTGPSGSGKTTLCSCINGLIPHFHHGVLEGQVLVRGKDTRRTRIGVLASIVGMVFQDPESQLIAPTVADEVAFGPENLAVPREEILRRVEESLQLCRLQGFEERVPYSLSGGEQQACAIAAIYAMYPEIYVMDEPTSNLDPLGTQQVLSLIVSVAKQRGKTLVIAEHKLEELLPLVDRVLVMDRGRVVRDGSVEDVLRGGDIPRVFARPPIVQLAHRLGLDGCPMTAAALQGELERHFTLHPLKTSSGSGEDLPGSGDHATDPVIEIKDLWYSYDGINPALRGVNLTVHRGELIAILGRNGSGKSTLLRHINGLLLPERGQVQVFGRDTREVTTAQLARRVGFCFQNPNHQLIAFVVREELAFGLRNLGLPPGEIKERSEKALAFVGMSEYMDTDILALGKGQKQRVALASVLTMEPEILIIDEPTTGQDPEMTRDIFDIMRRLNEAGTTVIMVTHKFDYAAAYTRRSIILQNGRIVYDGPSRALLGQAALLHDNSLEQPEITRLAAALRHYNVPQDIVTVDEMYHVLSQMLGGS